MVVDPTIHGGNIIWMATRKLLNNNKPATCVCSDPIPTTKIPESAAKSLYAPARWSDKRSVAQADGRK